MDGPEHNEKTVSANGDLRLFGDDGQEGVVPPTDLKPFCPVGNPHAKQAGVAIKSCRQGGSEREIGFGQRQRVPSDELICEYIEGGGFD